MGMTRQKCTRILPIANGDGIPGGWLDDLRREVHGNRLDLLMDYRELRPVEPVLLIEQDGKLVELVRGEWVARRLRFQHVTNLLQSGLYAQFECISFDHPARSLRGLLHWRTPEGELIYILIHGSDEPATLSFSARKNRAEECPSADLPPVEIVRDWSPSPQLPVRTIARPGTLEVHRRFGGDPVAFSINGIRHARSLFIGGVDCQSQNRPKVDAVLNLAEKPSTWAANGIPACDRWSQKGEARSGMSLDEIAEEARWVIERLKNKQRVLVHCWAGMNRSATICCAVLILLEGLTAEQALERVREHHPWARPDSHHWLMLRHAAVRWKTSGR